MAMKVRQKRNYVLILGQPASFNWFNFSHIDKIYDE